MKVSDVLTINEIANVLAALRYWQRSIGEREQEGEGSFVEIAKFTMPDHFATAQPLHPIDIDQLCEVINQ